MNNQKDDSINLESWNSFKRHLLVKNRFILDEKQENFIKFILSMAKKNIEIVKQKEVWYRARKYYEDFSGSKPKIDGEKKIHGRFPAQKEQIVAPPREIVKDGRANPRQFTMLYLAKEEKTAIVETRPILGEFVTVASFEIDFDCKVVNLTAKNNKNIDYFQKERLGKLTNQDIKQFIWHNIGLEFSKPTNLEDSRGTYLSTQYIASIFIHNGFDGILYSSSLKKGGTNIVLFHPESANPKIGKIFYTKSIDYSFMESGKPEIY